MNNEKPKIVPTPAAKKKIETIGESEKIDLATTKAGGLSTVINKTSKNARLSFHSKDNFCDAFMLRIIDGIRFTNQSSKLLGY